MFSFLRDRPIFQQLFIPILMVGVIGLAVTIYSATVLEQSVLALGKLYSVGDRKLRLIEDIETSINRYRALGLRHLATEDASSMEMLRDDVRVTSQLILERLQNLQHEQHDEPEQAMLLRKSIEVEIRKYFAEMDRFYQLSMDFEKELAFEHLVLAEKAHWSVITESLSNLNRIEFERIAGSRNELIEIAKRNVFITIALGIFGGIALLMIAFVVSRRITRRLSMLLSWSKLVSVGNLSATLNTDSEDEVGMLTRSMGEMASSVRIAHNELAESKKEAESTAEALKIYANAFEYSGEAILISDRNNRILNVNGAFTRQTGFTLEEIRGKGPEILASGQTPRATYEAMWQSLDEEGFWQGELWDRKKTGEVYPKWVAISAIRDDENAVSFYIASFTDISERKESEAKIEHLAHHDILTGTQNRFSLDDRLDQSLSIARRDEHRLAVLFIDLDYFKKINDSLGHHIGDQLLVNVAQRLRESVRESDIVARIGGDEFVIVLTEIDDTSDAAVVAETIQTQLNRAHEIEGVTLEITPSIGISIFPDDTESSGDLLRYSDIAMYHAKEQGRNAYQFFTESMLAQAQGKLKLERELRIAIEENQLELHYQPQLSVGEQRICGMEALVRWQHPVMGMIPPLEFISVAESSGTIHALGEWVLNEACRQLAEWNREGFTNLIMAINLSARQLHSEDLEAQIRKALETHGVNGSDLELEITETAAMNDPDLAVNQLNAIRRLGVGLAIDDFGTGYSSLAYLKRLPIQILKLDKTFVRDIETDTNDAEISIATLALAHNLGLKVVAEGVETEAQKLFFELHGCDYLQGYLFSKPVPAQEAELLLARERGLARAE